MEKQQNNNGSNKMPRDNPFSVPEGYFENLAGQIEEKIKDDSRNEKKIVSFWSSARNQLALAAGFVLFVLISYAVMHFIIDGNALKNGSELHYAEIIESEIQNYETELLIDAYIENSQEDEMMTDEIFDEEMIEYLISEDVEIEMIIVEF